MGWLVRVRGGEWLVCFSSTTPTNANSASLLKLNILVIIVVTDFHKFDHRKALLFRFECANTVLISVNFSYCERFHDFYFILLTLFYFNSSECV